MNYLAVVIVFISTGITLEVFWTAMGDFIKKKDLRLMGNSYIWMIPVYGLVPFIYKITLSNFQNCSIFLRGFIYMIAFYLLEYTFGFTIKQLTGRCPWDYSKHYVKIFGKRRKVHFQKIITLEYAPAWYIYGILFELYYLFLIKL
jgi:hypothetical protein